MQLGFIRGTMLRLRRGAALIVLLAIVASAQPSRATILTFTTTPLSGSNQPIPLDYGSNVTSMSAVLSDGNTWNYLEGSGFTPNITTNYQIWSIPGNTGTLAADGRLAFYPNSGDLPYAAYSTQGGSTTAEIDLIPQAGYSVTLNSFDLAGYFGGSFTNQPVLIYDANYNLLANFGGPQTIPSSTHVLFSPDITSSGMLRIQFGNNDDVGIGNVDFNQFVTVPEPSSWLLLSMGAALFIVAVALRRRARARPAVNAA